MPFLKEHGGIFGGATRLNIFTGLAEPLKKEGIWIKTTFGYKKVVSDSEIYFANDWIDPALNLSAKMPYKPLNTTAATIDKKIYVISGGYTYAYVYDTETNIWTKLADIPVKVYTHNTVAVGTKIYVLGDNTSPYNTHYCYDTLANSWTQLASIPFGFTNGSAAVIDKKIYILGSNNSSFYRYFYCYDTVANSWTRLPDAPTIMRYHTSSVVGTKIFSFVGNGTYCFDTFTNTWSTLANRPISVDFATSVSVGSKIYVMGGLTNNLTTPTNINAIYDTVADSWSTEKPLLNALQNSKATIVKDKIHLFGGSTTSNNNDATDIHHVFSLKAKVFEEDTFVIFRNSELSGLYYTEFTSPQIRMGGKFTRTISGFNNAWLYKNNDLLEFPTYYGDGTKWIKFKN